MKLSKTIWNTEKLKQGDIIKWQGKKYKVLWQNNRTNSFYFKNSYYTCISEVK